MVPLRDRLQLERRAFDDPILLTLFGKLIRCQVCTATDFLDSRVSLITQPA